MLISNFYPVLAGAEQQALNLSRTLFSQGIPVSVLTRSMEGTKAFEQINNIPVYREIHVFDKGKWFGITYILSTFYFLLRKRHTYNIIHCHIADGLGYVAALLMKFIFNKKVIVKIALSGPSSDLNRLKKSFLNRLCLKLIHSVDKIIIISTWSEKEALEIGLSKSKITFIPNGVNIKRFKPPSKSGQKSGRIIYVGRLVTQKGVDILLQAFADVIKESPSLILDIVGDGPEKEMFQDTAEKLEIKEKVIFHGVKQKPYYLFIKADIFVLPSRSEGLPNVLLEAMSCGMPVIATKVSGNLDIIKNNENGILIEKENPKQLANAIKKILNDSRLAEILGTKARETVIQNYSIEHTVSKYIKLYTDLLR